MPRVRLTLSSRADFVIAISAIYRSILAGLEWYFSFFAAFGTYCREHLALVTIATASAPIATASAPIALRLPCSATRWTALWLIGIPFGLEEALLLATESEGSATIRALESFVFKDHWMTSSVYYIVRIRSSDNRAICDGLIKYLMT